MWESPAHSKWGRPLAGSPGVYNKAGGAHRENKPVSSTPFCPLHEFPPCLSPCHDFFPRWAGCGRVSFSPSCFWPGCFMAAIETLTKMGIYGSYYPRRS